MLFTAIIEKDENGYFAYVPSLDGCVSCGDTYEEALFNINEAAQLYIQTLKDTNKIKELKNKSLAIVPLQVAING